MAKLRFIVVGSGWRSLFYWRIAQALPERFELCAMLCRTEEKAEKMHREYGVPIIFDFQYSICSSSALLSLPTISCQLCSSSGSAGTLCALLGVGEPTLNDIVAELCKPGRDVRDSLPKPLLRSDVMGLDDLKPGMELTGTVRNVIDFGAFVDLGVHQDGLVHVSQISDKFIKHPRELLKVGDIVRVKVLSVDTGKKRIALTMKGVPQQN